MVARSVTGRTATGIVIAVVGLASCSGRRAPSTFRGCSSVPSLFVLLGVWAVVASDFGT